MSSKYYDRLFPTESPPKSLHKFSYFPKLPPEVQAMIWKAAAADDKSRIVEFFIKKDEPKQEKELRFHHQPPALLHVNQQARKWTIRYLQAFLGREHCFIDHRKDVVFMEDSIVPKVYASWIRDEISRYRPEVEKKIRFLVMGGIDGYSSMRDLEKCGYANFGKIVLEKQEGDLTPEQKAHLRSSWVCKPRPDLPSKDYHYISQSLDEECELSLLTEQQMTRKTILQELELETSGSISIEPTPKIVAGIKSNSNPIPQNHRCPS